MLEYFCIYFISNKDIVIIFVAFVSKEKVQSMHNFFYQNKKLIFEFSNSSFQIMLWLLNS